MFNEKLLAGRRILVTGGGTGLGKSMAARFLELGAEVHICGRRKAVCDETATELMDLYGGRVTSHGVDIRNALAVAEMIATLFREGPLTDLINNAAGNFISWAEELSLRGFDDVANIARFSACYVTHASAKAGQPLSTARIGSRWTALRRWRWAATSISCATGRTPTGPRRATRSRRRTKRTARRGADSSEPRPTLFLLLDDAKLRIRE